MRKFILIFALIPLMAFAQYGQRGSGGGSTFYWSLTGQAQKTDSLRIIQGTNMTITQSGNTVTFNGAAGAGSTANVREDVGWTASGTLARDTLYTNYAIFGAKTFGVGGTTQAQNARAKFNVLGRASADTLAIFSNDGGGVVGDSTVMIDHAGRIGIKTAPSASYSLTNLNGMLSGWYDASIGSSGNANTLVSLQNSGSGAGTGATINIDGTVIRGIERSSVVDLELVAGTNGRVSLIPGASGSIMIGQGAASTTSQAFVTIRTQTPTADTLFMARNDKDATLDSTAMIFANGSILRRDTKQLPAGAWLATASNGAALSSSNYMVTYAFDSATAETLTVDFALPPNFIQISNVEIEVVSPNTDGDSVGFAIAWLGRAADEAFNVAFSSPLSGQIDLGTTADVRKILTISGTFDNLAASDRIILKLWRDPSVANDVAADVHLVEVRVNGNGLLY